MISRYCFLFLQWKEKLERLLSSEIRISLKTGYKNVDYRKLVTNLYNSHPKRVNRTTTAKNESLPCKNNEWKLNCDDKQKIKKKLQFTAAVKTKWKERKFM